MKCIGGKVVEKKINFQSICADYSCKDIHVFDIDNEYNDYDCYDTCVIWNHITFYGIPFGLLDEGFA